MHTLTQTYYGFRLFAREHDHYTWFHALFLVSTLVAASMLNLGCFALLIATHMALDVVKYRDGFGWNWARTMRGVFQESLIDLTLFSVALVFSVYLHHQVAMVGVSGLVHAEIFALRLLGILVPKFAILQHLLKVLGHVHVYLQEVHPALRKEWRSLDTLYLFFIGVAALLLWCAPLFTGTSADVIAKIVLWELTPWQV